MLHSQPAIRRAFLTSNAANVAGPVTGRGALAEVGSPASPVWQSDFEDRSKWEHDWMDDRDEEPDDPAPAVPAASPSPAETHIVPTMSAAARRVRDLRIAEAVAHLRENHECEHDEWRGVRGAHHCKECFHMLPQYIFECRQCRLQACNRCRRNRL